jgi:hypothetical protein
LAQAIDVERFAAFTACGDGGSFRPGSWLAILYSPDHHTGREISVPDRYCYRCLAEGYKRDAGEDELKDDFGHASHR